jgi:hypothetical protein
MIYLKKNPLKSTIALLICFNARTIESQNNNSNYPTKKTMFSNIKTCIQQIKVSIVNQYSKQYNGWFKERATLSKDIKKNRFFDALTSGIISDLVTYIRFPDLDVSEAVFTLFERNWPWTRDHTFLIPNLDNNMEESDFISHCNIDIMKIVEIEHITRMDYVIKYTDAHSLQIIMKCIDLCTSLQTNADLNGLCDEINRLRHRVIKNGKKTVIVDNICLAIAEKIYLDPITTLLHTVKHAPTLKEAKKALDTIEDRMKAEQARGKDITHYCSVTNDHLQEYVFELYPGKCKNKN